MGSTTGWAAKWLSGDNCDPRGVFYSVVTAVLDRQEQHRAAAGSRGDRRNFRRYQGTVAVRPTAGRAAHPRAASSGRLRGWDAARLPCHLPGAATLAVSP